MFLVADEVARAWAETEIDVLKAEIERLTIDRDALRVVVANVLRQYDEIRDERDEALAHIERAEGITA